MPLIEGFKNFEWRDIILSAKLRAIFFIYYLIIDFQLVVVC